MHTILLYEQAFVEGMRKPAPGNKGATKPHRVIGIPPKQFCHNISDCLERVEGIQCAECTWGFGAPMRTSLGLDCAERLYPLQRLEAARSKCVASFVVGVTMHAKLLAYLQSAITCAMFNQAGTALRCPHSNALLQQMLNQVNSMFGFSQPVFHVPAGHPNVSRQT